MIATAYCESADRGNARSHLAVRLADEGIPIGAIARVLKLPFREASEIINRAKASGQIIALPPRDWPHGQVRYVPGNEPVSGPVGPRPISLDEAREAIPFAFNLTRHEAEMLAGIMTRELATRNWLHGILYADEPTGGAEPKIVDVFICKLRKKLRPFGIEIATVWGRGYRITAEHRDRIIALKLTERRAA